jgi:hypothetical protein
MTEAEAIQFLRKCERFWLGRKNLTVGEVIRKTRQNCFSIIALMLPCLFIATSQLAKAGEIGFWHYLNISLIAFSFMMIGLSTWLLIRLRQVRQVLSHSQIGNPKS